MSTRKQTTLTVSWTVYDLDHSSTVVRQGFASVVKQMAQEYAVELEKRLTKGAHVSFSSQEWKQ